MNENKDTSIFLTHILENCTVIEEKTKGVAEVEFHSSSDLQDILIRRIEVIGEAVKHLPKEFTTAHPKFLGRRSQVCVTCSSIIILMSITTYFGLPQLRLFLHSKSRSKNFSRKPLPFVLVY